jgi:serine/threonine protein kinase
VVRTFRTGKDGKPVDIKSLPYDLVPASTAIDLWSVGCLLYLLVTGDTLVPSNRDDDFSSGKSL